MEEVNEIVCRGDPNSHEDAHRTYARYTPSTVCMFAFTVGIGASCVHEYY